MRESEQRPSEYGPPTPSPFTMPAERTRPWSTDEVEVDIADPNVDLSFDDSNRFEEDAHPTSD